MDGSKLSQSLAERLEQTAGSELVDVVVELQPLTAGHAPGASRAQRIASLREAFQREAAPVEEVIRSVGGVVVGGAWVNQVLRARIPAERVTRLADLDEVFLLDLPRPLELLDGS